MSLRVVAPAFCASRMMGSTFAAYLPASAFTASTAPLRATWSFGFCCREGLPGSGAYQCARSGLERLHHYQDNDPDHKDRRQLIDNSEELLASPIPIGLKILLGLGSARWINRKPVRVDTASQIRPKTAHASICKRVPRHKPEPVYSKLVEVEQDVPRWHRRSTLHQAVPRQHQRQYCRSRLAPVLPMHSRPTRSLR